MTHPHKDLVGDDRDGIDSPLSLYDRIDCVLARVTPPQARVTIAGL